MLFLLLLLLLLLLILPCWCGPHASGTVRKRAMAPPAMPGNLSISVDS